AVMEDQGTRAVRFEVLGPLRAVRAGITLDLGPLHQRAVLAVLLLHANRPAGRQQLIDAVWGDAPPSRAVNLLQRHVSALRRVLQPDRAAGTSGLLSWTDAGYVLEVAGQDLDLMVFDQATAQARAARADGHPEAAAEALHFALGLWRGAAFDGVVTPYL